MPSWARNLGSLESAAVLEPTVTGSSEPPRPRLLRTYGCKSAVVRITVTVAALDEDSANDVTDCDVIAVTKLASNTVVPLIPFRT